MQLYRLANGGDTWAGAPPEFAELAGPGLTTYEIDASRIIWQFFEDVRLPRR